VVSGTQFTLHHCGKRGNRCIYRQQSHWEGDQVMPILKTLLLILLSVSTIYLSPKNATAAELKVLAIGAVTPLIVALSPEFEKLHGHRVVTGYGPTIALAERLRKGEQVDAFFGAPPVWDQLVKEGRIENGHAIARSGIGLGIRKGSTRPSIESGAALRKTLLDAGSIGGPGVGIGAQVLDVFQKLGISEQVLPKYRRYPNGRAIVRALLEKEIDIGISVVADMAGAKEIEFGGAFPPDVQQYVTVRAAVTVGAANAAVARQFIDFVRRPDRAQLFKDNWLEPQL
jgi:molybdate transport system substrate-binding protein